MELSLKKCSIHDLEPLRHIARETFISSFADKNDPVDFQNYMEHAFSMERIRKELLNPDSDFYLVQSEGRDVGYLKLNYNSAQTDIKDTVACELERIYVKPAYQGKGIGNWMLDQAILLAGAKQKRYVWLGVWQENEGAIRFYEQCGFYKFGTHPYYIGSDKQTDWLMRIDLVPS